MTDLLFVCILIYAALYDQKNHRIPDGIACGIGGLFLIAWLTDMRGGYIADESYYVETVLGAVLPLVSMMLIDWLKPKAFGGGDIKLIAALGLYLGLYKMITAVFLTIITAGISCLILLFLRKINAKSRIALGPFIAAGAIMALFWGDALFKWFI